MKKSLSQNILRGGTFVGLLLLLGSPGIVFAQTIPLSNDATLSALTTSIGTLSPSFDPTITTYNLSVPTGMVISTLPVTATTNDPNATVSYSTNSGGVSVLYYEDIIVTAQDGMTKQLYRIHFVYAPTITNITSASGSSSGSAAGGNLVLITGINISGATVVDFGINAAVIIFNNDTAIIASSPAGTGTVDVTVTTPDGTSAISTADQFTYVVPDGTITLSTTLNPDGTLSGTITDATIASTTSNGFPVISYIPAGTVVTGPSTWNGMVYPPTNNLPVVAPSTVVVPSICAIGEICIAPAPEPSSVYSLLIPPQGTATSTHNALLALLAMSAPVSSIDIGFGSTPLALANHAVRIVIVGGAGTAVGYTHDWTIPTTGLSIMPATGVSSFTPITNVCSADSQSAGDALLATPGTDCYINVGPDLVVWTTHFSNFTNTSGLVGISPSGSIVITSGSIATPLVPTVGSLVVNKDTVGGDGTFSFTSPDGSSFSITTANGTGSYIITDLASGTYTVTEPTQPKGWKQTSTDCSTVIVTAGNIASCTITDTKNGAQKPASTTKDKCKDGNWETFTSPYFKNQGQCVNYVQTNNKNDKADTSVGNLPPNGSPNAKVKIVEYGNYYDPFSRMFFQNTEQQLRAEYIDTGKVAMYWKDFVFPDFPGLLGDTSAANAARCANEQGMFWQYHDLLLAPQIDLGGLAGQLDFRGFGEQLGLNMIRFGRCLDTERHLPLVKASSQNAVREGISAVPTFFINGRPVIGAQSFEEFKRIIEEELAK